MVTRSIACAVLLVLASPLAAQSPQDLMFPGGSQCYARAYTAEHLADHPEQQVTTIAVSPAPDFAEPLFGLYLRLELRNVPGGAFEAYAACENEGADTLFCTLEGDAGAYQITPDKDGAILIEVSGRGMSLENRDVIATIQASTGDDRSFILYPAPCP